MLDRRPGLIDRLVPTGSSIRILSCLIPSFFPSFRACRAQDKEYLRFTLGKQPMIPALEEALSSMKPGGIRQVGVVGASFMSRVSC